MKNIKYILTSGFLYVLLSYCSVDKQSSLIGNHQFKTKSAESVLFQSRFAESKQLPINYDKLDIKSQRNAFADIQAKENLWLIGRTVDASLRFDEYYSSFVLKAQEENKKKDYRWQLPIGKTFTGETNYRLQVAVTSLLAVPATNQNLTLLVCESSKCLTTRSLFQWSLNSRWQKIDVRFKLNAGESVWLQTSSDCLLGNLAISKTQQSYKGKKTPNILLIVSDTTRSDAISANRAEAFTPTISGLAENGFNFKKAFANSNWTRPSLLNAFYGRQSYELGINNVYFEVSASELKHLHRNFEPFPSILQRLGFKTTAIMDNIFALENSGIGANLGFAEITNISQVGRQTSAITTEAIKTLKSMQDQPFFLFIHYNNAHFPYNPPVEYLKLWQKKLKEKNLQIADPLFAKYLASLTYIDAEIAKVLAALKESKLEKETIIIFTSDHGELFSKHHDRGNYFVYTGIHSHGETLADEELNIPFIVHMPAEYRDLMAISPERAQQQSLQLKSLKSLVENLIEQKPIDDAWFEQENSFPFMAEGRFMTAIFNEQQKWIYRAPGYEQVQLGYMKQTQPIVNEFYNRNTDPLEKNPLLNPKVWPEFPQNQRDFTAMAMKSISSIGGYSIRMRNTESLKIQSKYGFYYIEGFNPFLKFASHASTNQNNDCQLNLKFNEKADYRPVQNKLSIVQTGNQLCEFRIIPFPLTAGFTDLKTASGAPFYVGSFAIGLSTWRGLHQPLLAPVKNFYVNRLPLISIYRNWLSYSLPESSKKISGDIEDILKGWGYIQ